MRIGVPLGIMATISAFCGAQGQTQVRPSDWNQIRAAHEQWQRTVTATPTGARAVNRGQQWTANFDQRGFVVRPAGHGDGWAWGLELEGGAPSLPHIDEDKVRFNRGAGIEEWFRNGADGLEQGFTINSPQASEQGRLEINLRVRGTLDARGDGAAIQFTGPSGVPVVTYGGLKAWDAAGHALTARMEGRGRQVHIEVDDRGARYPITIDPIAQQSYLKASNTQAHDNFGYSVSVSGDTIVVGAPGEDSSSTQINPGPVGEANNDVTDAGAAYVFVRLFGAWRQQAYLKPFKTGMFNSFGTAVSISGDTIAVGAVGEASRGGAAYVFTRSIAGIWTQQSYLRAPVQDIFDSFGTSISVSGDTLVVGAPGESSDATTVDGDQVNNRAPSSGAAYVFARASGAWIQQAYLKASNTRPYAQFGTSVSADGATVVVGSRLESSAATGVNGNQADQGASDAGAAYVYVRQPGVQGLWTQQAYLKASNTGSRDQFGHSVTISGNTIIVGARCEGSASGGVNANQADNSAFAAGAAYVFVRNGAAWTQQAYLKASQPGADDQFGFDVSLSGNVLVVGAPLEASKATGINGDQADNSAALAGAAYLFVRKAGAWTQQAYVKASNTTGDDRFGISVSASIDTFVIGADHEDSNGVGVLSNQLDASATDAGAAYVFTVPQDPPLVTLNFASIEAAAATPVTMTITIENVNPRAMTPVAFVSNFPAGLTIYSPSDVQNTCGGTVVAIPGTSKLTFADGSIDAGTMCTMTARVMSIASGPSTVALQVTSPAGSSNLAQATLNVSLPPRLDQTFSFAQAPPGVTVATTLTFTNLNRLPLTPVALVETLPQDLNIASPNGLTSTCGGTVTATPGTNTISLGSGVLPPGTCSITLNVSSSKVGTYSTTVAVITPAGWSNAATASLIVAEGLRALDLTQTFSKAKLPVGGVVSLALLLTNPNPGPIPGVAITTALPPGLAVATPNGLVNTCAGPVAAIPGTRSVTLANGTVPGAGSCQISLSVQAMAPGEQISTTGPSVGAASTTFAPPTVKSSTFVMSPRGSYQVRYAANLPFGDSILMLSNTGVSFTGSTDVNDGSLCVSVYAYSSTEQLVSCCSCLVTGSGLNLLSAQKDLVPNTLSLQSTPALVVKLLASAPQSGACNPALVTYDKLKPGLAAWGTTTQVLPLTPGSPKGTYGTTSRPFVPAELSTVELSRMTQLCGFVQANGSGLGICKSCRFGGLGADTRD